MTTLFDSIKSFLAEPFAKPMSFWQYGAIVGITILIVIFWLLVLQAFERTIKEV